MLTTELLTRSIGDITAKSTRQALLHRQLLALQPAPRIRFDGQESNTAASARNAVLEDDGDAESSIRDARNGSDTIVAHKAGVNALAIDRFEGR